MAVALYMDVHVPRAITEELRRRGVDVLTAVEDGQAQTPDDALLKRSSRLQRVIFTHDVRFKAMAEDWQRTGKPFAGLLFGHPLRGTIGEYVESLHLIATASDPQDWIDCVDYLPY